MLNYIGLNSAAEKMQQSVGDLPDIRGEEAGGGAEISVALEE